MRACLDTLIENALRYTRDGDTVRLFAFRDTDRIEVGVADSGVGLSAEQIALINGAADADAPRDDLSQTGLGLGLVRGVVAARGGRLRAGAAPEGGAMVAMQFPVDSPMGPVLTEAPAMEGLVSAPSETDVRRAGRAFSAAHSLAAVAARKAARKAGRKAGGRSRRLRATPAPVAPEAG